MTDLDRALVKALDGMTVGTRLILTVDGVVTTYSRAVSPLDNGYWSAPSSVYRTSGELVAARWDSVRIVNGQPHDDFPCCRPHDDVLYGNPYDMDAHEIATTNQPTEIEDDE